MLQILFLAAVAAIVLYQLYATLGRRVGRQPEDKVPVPAQSGPPTAVLDAHTTRRNEGVAALKSKQPDFDPDKFLTGARTAYEQIVTAYAEGDRETLRPLLSAEVMSNFEQAMAARDAAGRTEKVEFLTPPRLDLESIDVEGESAKAVVRILAEVRTRTKDERGEGVDDRRTAELWTFEREVKSANPNWFLTFVAAAEA